MESKTRLTLMKSKAIWVGWVVLEMFDDTDSDSDVFYMPNFISLFILSILQSAVFFTTFNILILKKIQMTPLV